MEDVAAAVRRELRRGQRPDVVLQGKKVEMFHRDMHMHAAVVADTTRMSRKWFRSSVMSNCGWRY
jgi:hypothetical protein